MGSLPFILAFLFAFFGANALVFFIQTRKYTRQIINVVQEREDAEYKDKYRLALVNLFVQQRIVSSFAWASIIGFICTIGIAIVALATTL